MNINSDQAIHELTMGRAIRVGKTAFIHPEFAGSMPKDAKLIITAKRAENLFGKKFKNPVAVKIKNLAEAQIAIEGITKKKFEFSETKNKDSNIALQLSASGELLPAVIEFKPTKKLPVYKASKTTGGKLELVADAPLTLRDCREAKIYAFREEGKRSEHLAIVVGNPKKSPLVRVHSCCYTGDLLGSLACDCNDQLRGALKLMEKNGGGVLVYLMQEGRGIGLINKLRAYKLQAGGMDTVEANEFLGFDDEERGFGAAAVILKKLGLKQVKLISNNPRKAKELEKDGIKVTGLVPMIIKHEHNRHYLATKAGKSGHLIK